MGEQYAQGAQAAQQQQQNQNPQPNLKPLVDFKVYEPIQQQPKPPQIHPSLFMPGAPVGFPHQFGANQGIPLGMGIGAGYNPLWTYGYQQPTIIQPVIKTYKIGTMGPMDDHARLNEIFEDILPELPGGKPANTASTIGERMYVRDYVRNKFIRQFDGEDINFVRGGDRSLMKNLKFLDINPYDFNRINSNPYRGLPNDFLISRSCYPIKEDQKTYTTQCAVNSMGIIVKMFNMTLDEYNSVRTQNPSATTPIFTKNNYNIWREVAYYEFIMNHIIKQNICPNFTILYSYHVSEKCDIPFNRITYMKNMQKVTNEGVGTGPSLMPTGASCEGAFPVSGPSKPNTKYIGKGLIMMTEAPTYSLGSWATRTYEEYGNKKVQLTSGFYSQDVWLSILFQLMAGMYVLELNNIAFNDFTLQDNVYVKIIYKHENIMSYWKYIIDGFEYYIPNRGFLLLIDSNYKDVTSVPSVFTVPGSSFQDNPPFKIYGDIFEDSEKLYKAGDIKKLCMTAFKNAFSTNNFSRAFTDAGGVPPQGSVLELINKIYSDPSDRTIGDYIPRYMNRFLNNRIGTYLTEYEIKNVRDVKPELVEGKIVVYAESYGIYKFVAIGKFNTTTRMVNIWTRKTPENPDIYEEPVSIDMLKDYSNREPIKQNFKMGEPDFNPDNCMETYIIHS